MRTSSAEESESSGFNSEDASEYGSQIDLADALSESDLVQAVAPVPQVEKSGEEVPKPDEEEEELEVQAEAVNPEQEQAGVLEDQLENNDSGEEVTKEEAVPIVQETPEQPEQQEEQPEQQEEQVEQVQAGFESAGEDEDCEMLDLLCDAVEVEDYKHKRKEEVKEMNKIMDERLKLLNDSKKKAKMVAQEKDIEICQEQNSGIILREGTRRMDQDQIMVNALSRQFVDFERLDSAAVVKEIKASGKFAFFTVGVVVDKVGVLTSKSGKSFSILKLSDLVKYDQVKVRKFLEDEYKGDPAGFKQAFKSFTRNGYKSLSFMAFGDTAMSVQKITCGTVIGVLNPRLMQDSQAVGAKSQKDSNALSFVIESDNAILKIGYAQDYDVCSSSSPNKFSGAPVRCVQFVNKSVEKICEVHKLEAQNRQLARIQSNRIGLVSARVDCNQIRKEQRDANIGAFGGIKQLRKDNRPKPQLTVEQQQTLQKNKKRQEQQMNQFVSKRARMLQTHAPQAKTQMLRSTENKALLGKRLDLQISNNDLQKRLDKEAEDSDSGLEIEGFSTQMTSSKGSSSGNGIPSKTPFKDFLEMKKMSYTEKFGKSVTATTSVDLKRKKVE